MEQQPQKMTDEEATPFDWFLYHFLRDELFNPKYLIDENSTTGGAGMDGPRALANETI